MFQKISWIILTIQYSFNSSKFYQENDKNRNVKEHKPYDAGKYQ